jgi:hypothetical protein
MARESIAIPPAVKRGAAEKIFEVASKGEPDVPVGTQMLQKAMIFRSSPWLSGIMRMAPCSPADFLA